MSTYSIKIKDNDGSVGISGIPVDAAATSIALQAYYDAVAAVTIGTMGEGYFSDRRTEQVGSQNNAVDPNARKELYWHCKFTDDINGLPGSFSIPCAAATLVPGVIALDLGTGVGATLKSTFEAVARSKLGNAVTLNSVELKGRKAN